MKAEADSLPRWLALLSEEDLEFARRFILCSGSLKEMAKSYSVSYPTIRSRLDRLIQKVSDDSPKDDDFISLIKSLTIDGEMSYETARTLIGSYRKGRR